MREVLGGSVSGTARIEDYAVVSAGTVNGSAVISGHAWVRGGTVNGNAKVRDWALVEGGTVNSSARVLEHANIKGGLVTDIATAKGTAASLSGTLAGNAIIDGDYGDFFYGRNVTNGVAFGHQPYVGVPDTFIRPLPTGLYAAYDFATAHDSRILDQYGVTDGFTVGNPTWYTSDGRRAGFLAFNGVNQSVSLDRSVADLQQSTFTAWVKWSGGAGNQPILYLGAATNKCLFLTPDNGSGQVAFTVINSNATQSLTWSNALPIGVWTHVAVTLDGATGTLYVNGAAVASDAMTNRPNQFLAPNTATGGQQNYLARGAGGSLPYFRGAVDDVRFYATPLSASDLTALLPPASPVGTGTLYVDLRATNVAASATTTFATWTNLGATIGNFTRTGTATYSTNVASTLIPGVLFGGSVLYSSAVTALADITGASDRTIEVWTYNPALATEETMVSLGNRSGTRRTCAFNFGNSTGWGAVTHFNDDVPWGVIPSANAWHHLVYIYDGTTNAQIYVDGVLNTTKALAGVLATPTTDPINIGCQRATAAGGTAGQYFSGYINAVRIWGGVMTSAQVTANYMFGPWTQPATQGTLTFVPIANTNANAGVTIIVTNAATDPNQPPLPLTFSILSAPGGAAIDAASGLFTWRPSVAQADTTNLIMLTVQNQATPSLTATQSFTATINPVTIPGLANAQLTGGAFGFQISGSIGPDYLIQTSTNLSDWATLWSTNPVALPFYWTDPNAPIDPARFYRVLLGP
ncbi:MAG: LamG domain-containing protein [Verrucomicrobiota bacterium]